MGVGSRSADMSHTQSAVQPTNHFVKALGGGVFAAFWFCFVVVVDMRFGGGSYSVPFYHVQLSNSYSRHNFAKAPPNSNLSGCSPLYQLCNHFVKATVAAVACAGAFYGFVLTLGRPFVSGKIAREVRFVNII